MSKKAKKSDNRQYNNHLNYPKARKDVLKGLIEGKSPEQLACEMNVNPEHMEKWVKKVCIEVFENRFSDSSCEFDDETKFFLGQTEITLESDEYHLRRLSREETNTDRSSKLTKQASALRKERLQMRQDVGALPSKLFKPQEAKKDDKLPDDPEELRAEIARLEEAERRYIRRNRRELKQARENLEEAA